MAGDAEDQDGSIEVDMHATDTKDAVVRHGSVKTPNANADSDDPNELWAQRSKKVQKRITGMKRQFDQQLATQQAEFQRQLAERDDRLAALEGRKTGVATDDAAHEARMDAMQAQIAEAQENGDSQLVAKLTREMSKADAQYWSAKTAKQMGNGSGEGTQPNANGARPQAKTRVPTKAGLAFARANTEWWDDPDEESQEAKAYANALHTQMLADPDNDPEQPEYFETIRKKVAKRFPTIETVSTLKGRKNADPDDDEDEDEDAPAARRQDTRLNTNRRAPAQNFGTRGGEEANRGRRNVKVLTGAEQRAMQKVGMDPSNNAHVMAYVRSMNEMEAG